MSETIRTFIAAKINSKILNDISKAQEYFKRTSCDAKWVKTINMHLTLKFLGNLDQKEVDTVIKKLELITKDTRSIQTKLTRIGAFPNIERPRVIWAGLEDTTNEITDLAEKIEDILGKTGFKKEEHLFKPHITIGRIRSQKNISELSEKIKNYSFSQNIDQQISEIKFIKSDLTPDGPIYEDLRTFQLQSSSIKENN